MNQQYRQNPAELAHLRDLKAAADARTSTTSPTTSNAERVTQDLLKEGQYHLPITCLLSEAPDGTTAYVKTIPLPANLSPDARAKEERRIADQITVSLALGDHPNHVQLLDYTEEAGVHKLYYSVALGETVLSLVEKKAMTVEDVYKVTAGVARGLAYAHDPNRNGKFEDPIVHGDITPGNVVYDSTSARIIDYGASVLEKSVGGTYTTRLLTPGFAAREVAMGEATTRSDVFGLGMLIAYMITGKKPATFFDYKNELKTAELEAAVRLRTTDHNLIDLIQRCTQANPTDRPTAQQVVDYVTRLQEGAAADQALATLVSGIPSGLREEWKVPSIEATLFASAVVRGDKSVQVYEGNSINISTTRNFTRDEDKVIVLQEYLDTQPVSARDRTIIERVIGMIREKTQNSDIEQYLRQSRTQTPETIFGHRRDELAALYCATLGKHSGLRYELNEAKWNVVLEDIKFRSFVEAVADSGLTPTQIRHTFDGLYQQSLVNASEEVYDSPEYRTCLQEVRAGTLETEVTALRERFKTDKSVTKALNDPRYLALVMTIEQQEGLRFSGTLFDNTQEQGTFTLNLNPKKVFGQVNEKLVGDHEYRFLFYASTVVKAVVPLAICFAAYGAATSAFNLQPLVEIYNPSYDPRTSLELLADQVVVSGALGAGIGTALGTAISTITDLWSRRKTRDVYQGSIHRVFNPDKVIDAVQELLLQCPEYERLKVEIKESGTATQKRLTPTVLAQTVKEILTEK